MRARFVTPGEVFEDAWWEDAWGMPGPGQLIELPGGRFEVSSVRLSPGFPAVSDGRGTLTQHPRPAELVIEVDPAWPAGGRVRVMPDAG